MYQILPENLLKLASVCQDSLYIVGGAVRDYLLGYPLENADWDLASPMSEEEFLAAAQACGFRIKAIYRNTGTVKLEDSEGTGYEFTRFRSDEYVRGLHVPSEVTFTRDIALDAVRRDFRANAVYYDLKEKKFVDPLGGISDIQEKRLTTVTSASKVFGEDGLRLLRLARFAAQLGFTPDEECFEGAKAHCKLIGDVVPERIFAEMSLLLHADLKHGVKDGPYQGLKILHATGVLGEILPELTLGEGMTQRSDFHDHDVLEHSLRCVRYSSPEIRFAALFHDVGKPFCYLRDGFYHNHPEEGERLTYQIMGRWNAPKKLTEETARLVRLHMRDYNLQMKESKLRAELVEDYALLPKLLMVKQADFSACKDNLSEAPCVTKWKELYEKMRSEGVPFTLKELAVNGDDLLAAGVERSEVGKKLTELLEYCTQDGSRNTKEKLLKHIGKTNG